jgi:hypothetical protein
MRTDRCVRHVRCTGGGDTAFPNYCVRLEQGSTARQAICQLQTPVRVARGAAAWHGMAVPAPVLRFKTGSAHDQIRSPQRDRLDKPYC